jgi:tRNA U34 5-methylaminomethyl-2-thiouridine-forming methyltransferase MnmC
MMNTTSSAYDVVKLASGEWSVRSHAHGETFHPVIGPVAEAQALYVKQLNIRQRVQESTEEFVIWDVGLGAAANPLVLLKAISDLPRKVRIVSFDHSLEPLAFALRNTDKLSYLHDFEANLERLLATGESWFSLPEGLKVSWQVHVADFPALLKTSSAEKWPKPHAILYDAFSPARNAAMWSYAVFSQIYILLDPTRPCAMPTYSRSTMLRVTLLLAGFFVGAGHATGEKEETTIAANSLELLEEPLDSTWLKRARNSTSAEPLWAGEYRQSPLAPETWRRLLAHPQFKGQIVEN